MKTARIVSLLAPVAALVACSASPDDAREPTAQTHEDLVLDYCLSASCQVDGPVPTVQSLIDLGCGAGSELVSYVPEKPVYVGSGGGEGPPMLGWFAMCPDSAESAGLTPSCSYCLTPAPPGFSWYEWNSTEYRPCPSGCLGGREPPSI